MILLGFLGGAPVRFGYESVAIARNGGIRRACLRAGGRLTGALTLIAEVALLNARRPARPFVYGNVKWARHETVAASHAFRRVISNRAKGRFLKSADRANGNAGR